MLVLSLVTIVAVGGRIIHKQRITAQAKEEQLREFQRRMASGPAQGPPAPLAVTVYETVDSAREPPALYDTVDEPRAAHANPGHGPKTATPQDRALMNPHYAIDGALGDLIQGPLAPYDTVDEARAAHTPATPQDRALAHPYEYSDIVGALGDRGQAEPPTYATTPVVFDGSEADYMRQVDSSNYDYGEVGAQAVSGISQVPVETGDADGVVRISNNDYGVFDKDAPTSVDGSGVLTEEPLNATLIKPNSMYQPGPVAATVSSRHDIADSTPAPALILNANSMYVGGSTAARDPIDPTLVTATVVTGEAVYDIPMETGVKASAQTVVVTPGVQNLAAAPTFGQQHVYEVDGVAQGAVTGKRKSTKDNIYMTLLANTPC